MIEQDQTIYGVKLIQDAPFRQDPDTFKLVPFTSGDAEYVGNAVLEVRRLFCKLGWEVTEVHFK